MVALEHLSWNHLFIPARGGSKDSRKNMLKINGVPLLTRVAQICKNADIYDSIVVSTDDQEIKKFVCQIDVRARA